MKKIIICFILHFSCFVLQAQYPQLQGQWHLQSVTRSEGTIIYYDWEASKAKNVSPVCWNFSTGVVVILNDTTSTPFKLPTDTAEASLYSINNDTLTLINYFTKGEAETSTNAPVVSYHIESIDARYLTLVLYDKVWGEIRPIDKYSKRYVFEKVEVPLMFCFAYVYEHMPKFDLRTHEDTLKMTNYIIASIDTCAGYFTNDSLSSIYRTGMTADVYWDIKDYTSCAKYFSVFIPMSEAYMKTRGGDHTGGRVTAEFYYKLGYSQIKIGQKQQGCLNLKKAVELRESMEYSRALNELCN